MKVDYVAKNVILAVRDYKNWPAALKAIATRKEYETIILKNGLHIQASPGFKWLMNQIFYEKIYTPIPQLQIGPDDIVMDIGAHCGIFTIFAASLTKNTIYSFEPSPENFRYLENNVVKSNLKNVILFQNALDREQGSAKFLLNRRFSYEHLLHYENTTTEQFVAPNLDDYEEITVSTTTLAHVMEENHIERIDFLKLDCQGAEEAILSSTPREYLMRIQKIALEYHDHITTLKHDDLQKLLEDVGFTTLLKEEAPDSPLGLLFGWRESAI